MAETSLSDIPLEVAGTETSSITNGVRERNVVGPEADKPLPVVELKPFTRQVWRREKSFPEFYDKPQTANGGDGLHRRLQFDIEGTENTRNKDAATAAAVVLRNLERQRVYTSECRLTDMTGPRYKIKTHPSVEFSYNCRTQKSNGLIPEFIPRTERTRTTLQDVTRDDNTNKQYSLAKQAMSDGMTARQQDMKIHGGRVIHTTGNPRTQFSYLNPLTNYGQADSLKNSNHEVPESNIVSSLSDKKRPVVNGNISDGSRNETSAASSESSSVSVHVTRPRGRVPMKHTYNRIYKPLNTKQHVSVNIGGIRNALQVLSDSGPPTKLERQLTFEMEVNLEKCRRNIELPPPDSATHFHQSFNPNMFYDVNRTITLTKGEVLLRQGRDLNRKRIQGRRQSRGRPIPAVDFNRNVRQAKAVLMDSDMPGPHIDTLEEAFYHGLFDRMSDSSPRNIAFPINAYQFSRGQPLRSISSKGDNSILTPTTDTSTMVADSIPRELAASDVRLDEVQDQDQTSPRGSSYTSGVSPRFTTYLTEPTSNAGSHVMSLDSRVMHIKKGAETQTAQFSKAHFKPCSNVKLKDDGVKSDNEGIRAIT